MHLIMMGDDDGYISGSLSHLRLIGPGCYTVYHSTFILSIESEEALAWWMRYVCSMYSVRRCRKLSGSLKITGIVILESS